jgi:hypothetical protein
MKTVRKLMWEGNVQKWFNRIIMEIGDIWVAPDSRPGGKSLVRVEIVEIYEDIDFVKVRFPDGHEKSMESHWLGRDFNSIVDAPIQPDTIPGDC